MIDVIHFYKVDSLEKVKEFYGDILKFPLYKDQKDCLIYCMQGHGKVGFCTHHPKDTNQSTCITLVYQDKQAVDDMIDYLRAQDVVVESAKENKKFNIYQTFFKDANHLTIELQCFL